MLSDGTSRVEEERTVHDATADEEGPAYCVCQVLSAQRLAGPSDAETFAPVQGSSQPLPYRHTAGHHLPEGFVLFLNFNLQFQYPKTVKIILSYLFCKVKKVEAEATYPAISQLLQNLLP